MAKSVETLVNPELLVWARKTAGYMVEEAAEKLKIPPEQLEKWENGVEHPTLGKLRRAADIYKRPSAIFYLPEPPETPEPPHDFRTIGKEHGKYSPALLLEVRKARYRREVALDLMDELDEEVTPFKLTATIKDDPDAVAAGIRSILGISADDQFRWKNEYEALKAWRNALEGMGVLVFHTANSRWYKIDVEKMRGLSIAEDYFPVILLNSADAPNGRIFTLMHEFAHLLLHNGGVCDLKDYDHPNSSEKRIEKFCNMVSGAILVPAHDLLNQKIVWEHSGTVWSDTELKGLARRFSVSREVILRRLLILGKTTRGFYAERREQLLKEYSRPKSAGGDVRVPYHYIVLRNNGTAYTRLVFQAYYDKNITTADVSDYLGVKVKHLGKMEQEVMYGG